METALVREGAGGPSNLVKEESILNGSLSKPTRRWTLLGVVAVLALSLAVVTASAGASMWHAASAGDAVAAKKKCKKKKHRSAAAAKKRKCKKKKHATPVAPPVVTPPKGPIERILITWTGDADLDVHAWSNGLHDGWNETLTSPGGEPGDYEVQIPGTTYDNSESGGDSESIVETNPNPSVPMTFGICSYPIMGGETADVSVKWVLVDGTTQTDEFPLEFNDFTVDGDEQGGPPDPVDDWCPEAL
jgi:hypothetical protein